MVISEPACETLIKILARDTLSSQTSNPFIKERDK